MSQRLQICQNGQRLNFAQSSSGKRLKLTPDPEREQSSDLSESEQGSLHGLRSQNSKISPPYPLRPPRQERGKKCRTSLPAIAPISSRVILMILERLWVNRPTVFMISHHVTPVSTLALSLIFMILPENLRRKRTKNLIWRWIKLLFGWRSPCLRLLLKKQYPMRLVFRGTCRSISQDPINIAQQYSFMSTSFNFAPILNLWRDS